MIGMADSTIFTHQVCMAECIWPPNLPMALYTCSPDALLFHKLMTRSTVRLVTVNAERLSLHHRVTAWKQEFRFFFYMTLETHVLDVLWACYQVRAGMNIMTGITGDICH